MPYLFFSILSPGYWKLDFHLPWQDTERIFLGVEWGVEDG